MLDDWVATLCQDLGVDPKDPDVSEILDLARDAAHTVARPAAPLTTFVVGYAAGMRGGGREVIAATVRQAMAAIAAEASATEGEVPPSPAEQGAANRLESGAAGTGP
jgi:Domain of unknown function (DUF6457)